MKLTTVAHVSVDGVMQGLGGPDEDRRGGFERGGWALALFVNDHEAAAFVNQVYQHAGAFLFGRHGRLSHRDCLACPGRGRQRNAVRGVEEDLLERAGQVAVPHHGRRRGQRMMVQAG